MGCIARLFKAFVERHPRLASLDDVEGSLHFRDFLEDEGAQDRMHNECMTAVRLTPYHVSEARVNWMLAGGVTAQPPWTIRTFQTLDYPGYLLDYSDIPDCPDCGRSGLPGLSGLSRPMQLEFDHTQEYRSQSRNTLE